MNKCIDHVIFYLSTATYDELFDELLFGEDDFSFYLKFFKYKLFIYFLLTDIRLWVFGVECYLIEQKNV